MLRHALASLATLACLAAGLLAAPAAQATTSPGTAALTWAEGHATGRPYVYGAAGPYAFDCSGLVMDAYAHADIRLPHNTVAMVRSGLLERTYHPRPGDLAFWGPVGAPSHVELVGTTPGVTFGAHDTGTRVGFIRDSGAFRPDAFYHVRP